MAICTIIMGESGRGKSSSIESLDPKKTLVIKPIKKPFPFRSKDWKEWDSDKKQGSWIATDDSEMVCAIIESVWKYGKQIVVVDDAQYIMANEFMRRSKERGFEKFSDIASHFWNIFNVVNQIDDDLRVYVLSHAQTNEFGETRLKTIGKLLDEKIVIEGLVTTVLIADKEDQEYFFETQNDGKNTVKAPRGMFEDKRIPNDLAVVDKAITTYYEIGE